MLQVFHYMIKTENEETVKFGDGLYAAIFSVGRQIALLLTATCLSVHPSATLVIHHPRLNGSRYRNALSTSR